MNTNQQQVPCKQCILYAMCKLKYRRSSVATIMSLLPYCSILYHYLTDGSQHINVDHYGQANIQYSSYKIEQITRTFNWIRSPIKEIINGNT